MRSAASLFAGLFATAMLAGPALSTTERSPASGESKPLPAAMEETAPAGKPSADAVTPSLPKQDDPSRSEQNPAPETPAAASRPDDRPAADAPSTASVPDEDTPVAQVLRQAAAAKGLSREDRAAIASFYEGRGNDLLWISGAGFSARAEAAMAEIRRADDWGLEASAFDLPSPPRSSEPEEIGGAELKLTLAVLKYASHARGGRMDPKQLSNYIDRDPPLLAPADVLKSVAEAQAVDDYLRKLHPRHPQFEKLRQAYLALRRGTPPAQAVEEAPQSAASRKKGKPAAQPEQVTLRKLLHNMEQWRWMPEDLGQTYVWANIPEFTLRVMKDGKPIFTERLISGKPDTQTPIFSDEMETIVFHPFWGVPDSIKVKEILPSLARGGSVLAKNNLRIQYRGRDIDPDSVDWTATDIRNFHVYQPPGGGNVLGVVKFLFPNKHQVYMHDTPTKNLFEASQRTFSHGCMRIRNPVRLAEVLLGEDKGWDARRVASLVHGGPQNNNVSLDTKIPVHITYFTAWVDDDGKVNTRADVYGHEQRIQMGLEGKAHLIVKKKEDLGVARAEVVGRLAETKSSWPSSSGVPDWARKLFGN